MLTRNSAVIPQLFSTALSAPCSMRKATTVARSARTAPISAVSPSWFCMSIVSRPPSYEHTTLQQSKDALSASEGSPPRAPEWRAAAMSGVFPELSWRENIRAAFWLDFVISSGEEAVRTESSMAFMRLSWPVPGADVHVRQNILGTKS